MPGETDFLLNIGLELKTEDIAPLIKKINAAVKDRTVNVNFTTTGLAEAVAGVDKLSLAAKGAAVSEEELALAAQATATRVKIAEEELLELKSRLLAQSAKSEQAVQAAAQEAIKASNAQGAAASNASKQAVQGKTDEAAASRRLANSIVADNEKEAKSELAIRTMVNLLKKDYAELAIAASEAQARISRAANAKLDVSGLSDELEERRARAMEVLGKSRATNGTDGSEVVFTSNQRKDIQDITKEIKASDDALSHKLGTIQASAAAQTKAAATKIKEDAADVREIEELRKAQQTLNEGYAQTAQRLEVIHRLLQDLQKLGGFDTGELQVARGAAANATNQLNRLTFAPTDEQNPLQDLQRRASEISNLNKSVTADLANINATQGTSVNARVRELLEEQSNLAQGRSEIQRTVAGLYPDVFADKPIVTGQTRSVQDQIANLIADQAELMSARSAAEREAAGLSPDVFDNQPVVSGQTRSVNEEIERLKTAQAELLSMRRAAMREAAGLHSEFFDEMAPVEDSGARSLATQIQRMKDDNLREQNARRQAERDSLGLNSEAFNADTRPFRYDQSEIGRRAAVKDQEQDLRGLALKQALVKAQDDLQKKYDQTVSKVQELAKANERLKQSAISGPSLEAAEVAHQAAATALNEFSQIKPSLAEEPKLSEALTEEISQRRELLAIKGKSQELDRIAYQADKNSDSGRARIKELESETQAASALEKAIVDQQISKQATIDKANLLTAALEKQTAVLEKLKALNIDVSNAEQRNAAQRELANTLAVDNAALTDVTDPKQRARLQNSLLNTETKRVLTETKPLNDQFKATDAANRLAAGLEPTIEVTERQAKSVDRLTKVNRSAEQSFKAITLAAEEYSAVLERIADRGEAVSARQEFLGKLQARASEVFNRPTPTGRTEQGASTQKAAELKELQTEVKSLLRQSNAEAAAFELGSSVETTEAQAKYADRLADANKAVEESFRAITVAAEEYKLILDELAAAGVDVTERQAKLSSIQDRAEDVYTRPIPSTRTPLGATKRQGQDLGDVRAEIDALNNQEARNKQEASRADNRSRTLESTEINKTNALRKLDTAMADYETHLKQVSEAEGLDIATLEAKLGLLEQLASLQAEASRLRQSEPDVTPLADNRRITQQANSLRGRLGESDKTLTSEALNTEGAVAERTARAWDNLTPKLIAGKDAFNKLNMTLPESIKNMSTFADHLAHTVSTFAEWSLAAKGVELVFGGAGKGMTDAIHMDKEQNITGQYYEAATGIAGSYTPAMSQDAMNESMAMARLYGVEVTHVQESVGLWAKVTHGQLGPALVATNEAMKLAAVSGMNMEDIYRSTVAVLGQLHEPLSKQNDLYNIAVGLALKYGGGIQSLGGQSQDAAEQMIDGMTRLSAIMVEGLGRGPDTLARIGAQVAIVSHLTNQSGDEVATHLAAAFAKIEGTVLATKLKAPGIDISVRDNPHLIEDLAAKEGKVLPILQAGGVRPGDLEDLKTLIDNYKKYEEAVNDAKESVRDAAADKSFNKLQETTDMKLKQMQAGWEAVSIIIMREFLPTLKAVSDIGINTVIPFLVRNGQSLAMLGGQLAIAGGAYLLFQTVLFTVGTAMRVWSTVSTAYMALFAQSVSVETRAASTSLNNHQIAALKLLSVTGEVDGLMEKNIKLLAAQYNVSIDAMIILMKDLQITAVEAAGGIGVAFGGIELAETGLAAQTNITAATFKTALGEMEATAVITAAGIRTALMNALPIIGTVISLGLAAWDIGTLALKKHKDDDDEKLRTDPEYRRKQYYSQQANTARELKAYASAVRNNGTQYAPTGEFAGSYNAPAEDAQLHWKNYLASQAEEHRISEMSKSKDPLAMVGSDTATIMRLQLKQAKDYSAQLKNIFMSPPTKDQPEVDPAKAGHAGHAGQGIASQAQDDGLALDDLTTKYDTYSKAIERSVKTLDISVKADQRQITLYGDTEQTIKPLLKDLEAKERLSQLGSDNEAARILSLQRLQAAAQGDVSKAKNDPKEVAAEKVGQHTDKYVAVSRVLETIIGKLNTAQDAKDRFLDDKLNAQYQAQDAQLRVDDKKFTSETKSATSTYDDAKKALSGTKTFDDATAARTKFIEVENETIATLTAERLEMEKRPDFKTTVIQTAYDNAGTELDKIKPGGTNAIADLEKLDGLRQKIAESTTELTLANMDPFDKPVQAAIKASYDLVKSYQEQRQQLANDPLVTQSDFLALDKWEQLQQKTIANTFALTEYDDKVKKLQATLGYKIFDSSLTSLGNSVSESLLANLNGDPKEKAKGQTEALQSRQADLQYESSLLKGVQYEGQRLDIEHQIRALKQQEIDINNKANAKPSLAKSMLQDIEKSVIDDSVKKYEDHLKQMVTNAFIPPVKDAFQTQDEAMKARVDDFTKIIASSDSMSFYTSTQSLTTALSGFSNDVDRLTGTSGGGTTHSLSQTLNDKVNTAIQTQVSGGGTYEPGGSVAQTVSKGLSGLGLGGGSTSLGSIAGIAGGASLALAAGTFLSGGKGGKSSLSPLTDFTSMGTTPLATGSGFAQAAYTATTGGLKVIGHVKANPYVPLWNPISAYDTPSVTPDTSPGASDSGFTSDGGQAYSQDLAANVTGGNSAPLGGFANTADYTGGLNKKPTIGSRIAGGLQGAGEIYAGYKQGGLQGGIESGMGAASLLSAIAPNFGPWGMAVAGAVGLGSMLIHHDNPAAMPDKYDTQDYGQFVANFQGSNAANPMTANGQQFMQDQATSTLTGGLSEGQFISNYVKGKSSAQLTAVFGNEGTAIQQMFSQWTSQGMHDGKNGNLMIGASTYQWQQIQTLGTDAFTAINSAANNLNQALAPLISVNAYGTSGASFSPYYTPGYGDVSSLYNTPYNSNIPGAIQPIAANSYVPSAITPSHTVHTSVNLDGRVIAQTVSNYRSQKVQQGLKADSVTA